jgi:hypothetical protein
MAPCILPQKTALTADDLVRLWLLGVPIPVIILLWLFFGH